MNALNHPFAFQPYENLQAKESKPSELVPEIDELRFSEGDALRSPLISLVIPAYNEAAILQENLGHLYEHMIHTAQNIRWEFVIVNDGSRDDTGRIAADFARDKANVVIVHHPSNQGLGRALKSGFAYAGGDYIITLDIDLSYAPYHIEILVEKILETQAQIVVASPYMPGGRVSNVPRLRKELSLWANRFLSLTDKRTLSTFTGMVRIYDAQFLKGLNLKSTGMDINPEIIHKAQLLGARIEEVPAHLHWVEGRGEAPEATQSARRSTPRQSSMKIFRHTWAILFYGFLFRPVMFFIMPSVILFLLSLYANTWAIIHCISNYRKLAQVEHFPDPTVAVANAFQAAPHTFILGGMLLMLSIQLFSLGILAVQSKSYFEEIFYLASAIYRQGAPQPSKPDDVKLV
jgi:glycosyltransferase involved in cell wall biosynthesis